MSESLAYGEAGSANSDTHALFGRTMGCVAGSTDIDSAPLMASSIFLDALNVFQFFLQLFARDR
jgi:hypothetical protein